MRVYACMKKMLRNDYMDFQLSYNLYVERAERTIAKLHLMTETSQRLYISDWDILAAYNYTGGANMPLEAKVRGALLQEGFAEKLLNAAKWAGGEAWATLKAMGEKAGQLGAKALDGLDKILTMFASSMPGGEVAYEFIKGWTDSKIDIAEKKINESIEALIGWLVEIKDKIVKFVVSSLEKVGDGIKKMTHRALDILGFDKFLKEEGVEVDSNSNEVDKEQVKIKFSKKNKRKKEKEEKKAKEKEYRQGVEKRQEDEKLSLLAKKRKEFIAWLQKMDAKVVNPIAKALISGWDIKQIYNSLEQNPTDIRGLVGAGTKWLIENVFDLFPKVKDQLIEWLNKGFLRLPEGAGVLIVRISKLLVSEYSAPMEELAKRAIDVWEAIIGKVSDSAKVRTAAEELLDDRFPDFMQSIIGGQSAVETITRALLGDAVSAAKLVSSIFRRAITSIVSTFKETIKQAFSVRN